MPVKKRVAKNRTKLEVSPEMFAWLSDEATPEQERAIAFYVIVLGNDEAKLRELWEQTRDEVLSHWIAAHPGTRPTLWWKLEAPRQPLGRFPGCFWDGELPEPRKFISGAGCDASLISAYMPSFDLGVPSYWAAFKAKDAPTFESQGSYLSRHGLLSASEKRTLQPADYDAVEVLSPNCEVLDASEEWVRKRIPAARNRKE